MTGMLTILRDARADSCGGKATALATLLRDGLPVPDGFVVPVAAYRTARAASGQPVSHAVRDALAEQLARLGPGPVAVRSSAVSEDSSSGSAAGQYQSVLAVRGTRAVAEAVQACWASASSARAADYWHQMGGKFAALEPQMAVLVQRHIDAEASGVMFTPARPGGSTVIEACWGLGPSVVGGTVTPDTIEIASDGGIWRRVVRKTRRLDRGDRELISRAVPPERQLLPAVDDATATSLAALGGRIADIFGQPQDVEWAVAAGKVWILQSRPITAPLPSLPRPGPTAGAASWVGTPGSHGSVTGTARVLHGPSDFPRLQPGDVAICPHTDPAWTPLFRIAAAVVTETGGALCHAAIVARECGIPAVLGVPEATTRIQDGARVTINGTAGTITTAPD